MNDSLNELRDWLVTEHWGSVDPDRLTTISDQLTRLVTARVPGEVVEIGCYRGAMALWMRAVLDSLGDTRAIHVYDSFQGLPAPGVFDSDHLVQGDLVATTDDVENTHRHWKKPAPTMHPGWFSETLPACLPDSVAFAYVDGDFYDSIMISLEHCLPRLVPGGTLIVDDYADTAINPKAWDGLPGVKKACDDYFGTPSPLRVLFGEGDLAFGLYENKAR